MKLTELLKDIELGKVYTDKDRPPFKVNEGKSDQSFKKIMDLLKKEDIELQNEASSVDIGKNTEFYQGFSSKEAKKVMDDAIKNYAKELRKVQYKVIKDWMSKAKGGVIDYFDVVRGLETGDASRAYPYESRFLKSVLDKDKITDRFRKYFGGKKGKKR